MNLQLKPKAATDRILDLMADGRERTVSDVRLRLGLPEAQALGALQKLTTENKLVSKRHAKLNITIWRLPQ